MSTIIFFMMFWFMFGFNVALLAGYGSDLWKITVLRTHRYPMETKKARP